MNNEIRSIGQFVAPMAPKDPISEADAIIQKENIAGSAYIASQTDAVAHAKAMNIANQIGSTVDFVKENKDLLDQQKKQTDLTDVLSNAAPYTPKAVKYFENPDNLTVSQNDLQNLLDLEKTLNKNGFLKQSYYSAVGGLAQMSSGLAKSPAYIANMALLPSNFVRKEMGMEQVQVPIENDISKYYDEAAKSFYNEAPDRNNPIYDSMSKGDYSLAAKAIALQAISSLPQQAGIYAAMAAGVPAAGLAMAGVSTAAEKAGELQQKGYEPITGTAVAAYHGAVEAAFEELGTASIIDRWMHSVVKDFGKQSGKEFVKSVGKNIAANVFQEGSEEFLTSIAQDFGDYAFGVNPDAMKGSIARALEAGLVGGASGGMMAIPFGFRASKLKYNQLQQAEINKKTFQAIADTTNNSELKKNLPEAYKNYVEQITKDGPHENTYISVEGFNSYFQSKDISPIQAATELGINKEYNKAIESGDYIELKTADFADKFSHSEHFTNLTEHTKFKINEETPAEAKENKEKTFKQMQKEYEQGIKDKNAEEIKAVEESAKKVSADIAKQLVENNAYAPKAAKQAALFWEEYFKVLSLKTNGKLMPYDLFKDYGVKIHNSKFANFGLVNPEPINTQLGTDNIVSEDMLPEINKNFVYVNENNNHTLLRNNSNDRINFSSVDNKLNIDDISIGDVSSIAPFVETIGQIATKNQSSIQVDKSVIDKLAAQNIPPEKVNEHFNKTGFTVNYDQNGNAVLNKEFTLYQQTQDYQMEHRPPTPSDGSPAYNLTEGGMFPKDVYETFHYYKTGDDKSDAESFSAFNQIKNRPNEKVKIYRAIPIQLSNAEKAAKLDEQLKNYMRRGRLPQDAFTQDKNRWYEETVNERDRLLNAPDINEVIKPQINNGDWVTLSKNYAVQHGKTLPAGQYKILSKTVSAKELFVSSDSINELGYWKNGKEDTTLFQTAQPKGLSTLGLKSKLYETIQNKMSNSQDVNSLRSMLKDIKADEMKWSGLDEFLKGKEKVTKQEVLDYLSANQLKIEQKQYDLVRENLDKQINYHSQILMAANDFLMKSLFKASKDTEDVMHYKSFEDIKDDQRYLDAVKKYNLERDFNATKHEYDAYIEAKNKKSEYEKKNKLNPTAKYKKYKLDSGDNYREVLFTLPTEPIKKLPNFEIWAENKGIPTFKARSEWDNNGPLKQEYLNELNKTITGKDVFESSHFDEKNILAHTRLQDFTDKDGNKVLMVEEIQSDWHQTGREKGYKENESELKKMRLKIENEIDSLIEEKNNLKSQRDEISKKLDAKIESNYPDFVTYLFENKNNFNEDHQPIWDLNKKIDKIDQEINKKQDERKRIQEELTGKGASVPNAPFAKNWHEFVFKRLLVMASEQGYDKVAWTTGEQQGKRFRLSNHIDKLAVQKQMDGTYHVLGFKNDEVITQKENIPENELSAFVGLEFSKKIINDFSQETVKEDNLPRKDYSGLDLSVGGEGMKGFYDKILVDFAKKFGKQFDSKVANTELSNGDTVHSLEISPKLRETATSNQLTLFQEKQGATTFGPSRQFNIHLFEGKNESTFLHESAHFFFEVMADMSEKDGISQTLKDDYQGVLDWLGVKSREEVTEQHHEDFARAFEDYIRKGKAPSNKLMSAFRTFGNWLMQIYGNVKLLQRPVSKEITQIFDRMLATETQIAKAEDTMHPTTLPLDGLQQILSEKELLDYLDKVEWSRGEAKDILRVRILQDLFKTQDRKYKEKFNQLYDEEMKKAKELLVFKVIDQLKNSFKLSRVIINSTYSEFKNYLPNGTTNKDGFHPDSVAEAFGFKNGAEMLQRIAPYRRGIEEYVNKQVATRLKSEFPDILEQPELTEEALKAYHNENKGKVKKLEMELIIKNNPKLPIQIAKKLIKRIPTTRDVVAQARKLVGETIVRDLKPHAFLNNEKRYARTASEEFGRGNYEAAFEAKKMEYLNFELYRASLDAKQEYKDGLEFFKKLDISDEEIAKSRVVELVNTAQALLAEFGIIRKEKTAHEYLEKMKTYDPDAYERALTNINNLISNKGKYNEISYDTFIDLKDNVQALWDLARNRKVIEVEGKKLDLDEVIVQLGAHLDTLGPVEQKEYNQTVDKWGARKEALLGVKAGLSRMEHWATAVDIKPQGLFWKVFYEPANKAINNYRMKKFETMTKYKNILNGYKNNISHDKIISDEFKFIFQGKSELLMALLHTGNESNFEKLLIGRGWGEVKEDGTLSTKKWDAFIDRMKKENILTKADYDFVQSLWNLTNELKGQAQKTHRQVYGYYFNEITAKPFTNEFGTYEGGYVPAKIDYDAIEDVRMRQEKMLFEESNNSFQFPTTTKGFTKNRVENYHAPLSLDLNLLQNHIDDVIRFSYIQPTVTELNRLLFNNKFRQRMGQFDSQIVSEMIIPWLKRVSTQKVVSPSEGSMAKFVDKVANYLRRGSALQVMFGALPNTLMQSFGLFVANSKVNGTYLLRGLKEYVFNQKEFTKFIYDNSEWMTINQEKNIFDLNNEMEKILDNTNYFQDTQKFFLQNTYFFQSAMQNFVNSVVWKGAYEQGINNGMTHEQAVKNGDSVVRMTQGTQNPEDISRFETGTQTQLMFKQFQSYFNMVANLSSYEMLRIQREFGLRKGAGKMFYVYLSTLLIPAFMTDMLSKLLGGKFDEDEDGQYLDDLLLSFFGSQFKAITAPIPYAGPVLQMAYNVMLTKTPVDDRLSLAPAISIMEQSVENFGHVYNDIKNKGSLSKKSVKDSLTFIGVMTHTPTGPLGRPIGYMMDVAEGKKKPANELDYVRGLITGK